MNECSYWNSKILILVLVTGFITLAFAISIPIYKSQKNKAQTLAQFLSEEEEEAEKVLGISPNESRSQIEKSIIPFALIIPIAAAIGLGVVYGIIKKPRYYDS